MLVTIYSSKLFNPRTMETPPILHHQYSSFNIVSMTAINPMRPNLFIYFLQMSATDSAFSSTSLSVVRTVLPTETTANWMLLLAETPKSHWTMKESAEVCTNPQSK